MDNNNDSWTPLHWAAYRGEANSIKALLEQGADRESKDNRGRTPMMLACAKGHFGVIPTLLGTQRKEMYDGDRK